MSSSHAVSARRVLVAAMALAALALGATPVLAQQAKVPRIGWLSLGSADLDETLVAGLRQGLRELGYVEGQNIVIEHR